MTNFIEKHQKLIEKKTNLTFVPIADIPNRAERSYADEDWVQTNYQVKSPIMYDSMNLYVAVFQDPNTKRAVLVLFDNAVGARSVKDACIYRTALFVEDEHTDYFAIKSTITGLNAWVTMLLQALVYGIVA